MLGWPGTPTTAVTRPPPAAGPRLRNLIFASGSAAAFSSLAVVAAGWAASACFGVFLSADFLFAELFVSRSFLLCATITVPLRPSTRQRTQMYLKIVVIRIAPVQE